MTKEEFRQMCQSHGLKMISDVRAAGMERGYMIALTWAGKKNISLNLPIQDGDQKQYAKELKARLKETFGKNASAAWMDQAKYLTIFLNSKNLSDLYGQGVTPVLDLLRSLGLTAKDTCYICGKSGCDVGVPRGAAYAPAHRSCLEGKVSGAKSKADANNESGSYILGIIGAFLGMLVGILPTVFTILALERIYVLAFMLIPMASYAGYRLFKGKMNYAALIFSILFSIAGVFLLNFINLMWSLKDIFDFTFAETMSLVGPAFTDKSVWAEIIKDENFIKCFLFAALGIFLAWGSISRTSQTDVKDAQSLLDSAVPFEKAPSGFEYDPADYMPDADNFNK